VIPIARIRDQLATYGHAFEDTDHLPLARRYTAREYWTDEIENITPKGEYTYTEWELKDINGDGLPDLEFNTQPVAMQGIPFTKMAGSIPVQLVAHVPMPGPGPNSIAAMFDVTAVTLDSQNASPYREVFSTSLTLLDNTSCGIEMWQEDTAGVI